MTNDHDFNALEDENEDEDNELLDPLDGVVIGQIEAIELSSESSDPEELNPEDEEESEPSKKSLDDLTEDLIKMLKSGSVEIIHDFSKKGLKKPKKPPIKDRISFDLTPKDIKAHLDRYVIKQDEAKKTLAIAVCDHMNQIKAHLDGDDSNYTKQNVLMVGPTGVGKTYMIKQLAKLIGVPFVKSDATKFTETGYQGGDVEDLVRQLMVKAEDDIQMAQYGIIYVDEIDKIASVQSKTNKDVSGRGVQTNLLKLMEETEVSTKAAWDIQSQIRNMMSSKAPKTEMINTKHILFIVSGAFVGLDEISKKRIEGSRYGFERQRADQDQFIESSTADFVKFGLEPEFVGRLPVRVFCEQLDADDLYHVLKESEESLLGQMIRSFGYYGIEVSFTDQALRDLAVLAKKEETGARGLGTIFERLFRDYKFECPSSELTHFVVNERCISDPKGYLAELLADPDAAKLHFWESSPLVADA